MDETNAVLLCEMGTLRQVHQCPRLQPCAEAGYSLGYSFVTCSATPEDGLPLAAPGGDCPSDTAAACSFDRQQVLWCIDGRWEAAVSCPPSECGFYTPEGGSRAVHCTNGGYGVGDRCRFDAGAVVCSADLGAILGCSAGRTVVVRDCGAQHCALMPGNVLSCE